MSVTRPALYHSASTAALHSTFLFLDLLKVDIFGLTSVTVVREFLDRKEIFFLLARKKLFFFIDAEKDEIFAKKKISAKSCSDVDSDEFKRTIDINFMSLQ